MTTHTVTTKTVSAKALPTETLPAHARPAKTVPTRALPAYRPGLPAIEVHEHLREAVGEMRLAERNAVFWFSEVLRRKLFRELGYASIHAYGSEALGFSRSKTYHFIRLCESFESLPRL